MDKFRAAFYTAVVLCNSIGIARGQVSAPNPNGPKLKDPSSQVLAIDEARRIAMLHGDTKALDSLIGDDATIFWGDGTADNKTSTLELLRSGKLRYAQLEYEDTRVRIFGKTAVVTGRARIQLLAGGDTAKTMARLTRVYVRERNEWRLVASQTTRIP